jgi:urease accessory protein
MSTTTTTRTTTTMRTDTSVRYLLLSWFSPAYPIGAYTYSHGLEWAVEAGDVSDAAAARDWIEGVLTLGAGRSDAVLLAHGWRVEDAAALRELAEFARALAPTTERRLEAGAQGRAFLDVTAAAWPDERLAWAQALPVELRVHPVMVGLAGRAHGVPLEPLAEAWLHAFAANLISAAVRLVPLGQTDGQRLQASFERQVAEIAAAAVEAPLEEVGGLALLADIASMNHETQYTRLFRS